MIATLSHSQIKKDPSSIQITGSKSESNRLLILQALFEDIIIENCSNSDDSEVMIKALKSNDDIIDIHHAGTAMRFLTAYFAVKEDREVLLTGSSRMKERPIKILVDALNDLGAEISYEENIGYPPLRIKGKKLNKSSVEIEANVSSQYISALLLVGAQLKNGLTLTLNGKITSWPYINLTLHLLKEANINFEVNENTISVSPLRKNLKQEKTIIVESDWSSASYFYSLVALSDIGTSLHLKSYSVNAQQGDAALQDLYVDFGVTTTFYNGGILLKKERKAASSINFDLNNTPDIAQTIAVTCLGLDIPCQLTGLHTLKIKETDRLEALKIEIEKFGAMVHITEDSLQLKPASNLKDGVSIDTYNDHRMAMAFAPLVTKTNLQINDAMVVSKSYPDFYQDLISIGLNISF
ncbi:MAG: 3-phosphoshikimate 1-carboxyvinyltransferase [bacterium]